MSKKEFAERAREGIETIFRHAELDSDSPMRTEMKAAGLRYARVTVQDVDTGESQSFLTWTAGSIIDLERQLQQSAPWPKAFLDRPMTMVNAVGEDVEIHTTPRGLIKRQLLGGRRVGQAPETAESYKAIADAFYGSGIKSQRDYCRKTGMKRGRLARALNHAPAPKMVPKKRP